MFVLKLSGNYFFLKFKIGKKLVSMNDYNDIL